MINNPNLFSNYVLNSDNTHKIVTCLSHFQPKPNAASPKPPSPSYEKRSKKKRQPADPSKGPAASERESERAGRAHRRRPSSCTRTRRALDRSLVSPPTLRKCVPAARATSRPNHVPARGREEEDEVGGGGGGGGEAKSGWRPVTSVSGALPMIQPLRRFGSGDFHC